MTLKVEPSPLMQGTTLHTDAALPVRRRHSVVGRVLISYAIVTAIFALASAWSVVALRSASVEAELMRNGYLPLSRALRDLSTLQDTWNTQLNHVTSARNPSDIELWFDTVLRLGRPKKYAEVQAAIDRAFLRSERPQVKRLGQELRRESLWIERGQRADTAQIKELFSVIAQGQGVQAEQLRDQLLRRGLLTERRLNSLDRRVMESVELLTSEARSRELLAIQILTGLTVLAFATGGLIAWLTRRMLHPLSAISDRARAVASGDFEPRPVVYTNDELGELAATFESMVVAIGETRRRLLANERLAAIGKMAAHVTHEIRNPLSSIALNVELLSDEMHQQSDEAKALLLAIEMEITRLSSLTEEYLSIARQREPSCELEDLGRITKDAVQFMACELERHAVVVHLVIPDAPLEVMVDERQVKQGLYNLLRNAREAMPRGGTIDVTVKEAQGGVELIVEDEGEGFDLGQLPHIFEPFVSSKASGTGLGLAITREIVESHGGTVRALPRPEKQGARFELWFPSPSSEERLLSESET